LYETFAPQKAKALWDWLEFIYTPVHGSWLNMAEIELHVLNKQCLNRPLDSIEKVKGKWQRGKKIETIKTAKSTGSLLLGMHASNSNAYTRPLMPNLTLVTLM
jgi:hypothetical protein